MKYNNIAIITIEWFLIYLNKVKYKTKDQYYVYFLLCKLEEF